MRVRETKEGEYSNQIDVFKMFISEFLPDVNNLANAEFIKKYSEQGIPDVLVHFKSKDLYMGRIKQVDFMSIVHLLAIQDYTKQGLENLHSVLSFLQEQGVNFDSKNKNGMTPIFFACSGRNLVMIAFICQLYHDQPDVINREVGDITPIDGCAFEIGSGCNSLLNAANAVKLMLKHGAKVKDEQWDMILSEFDDEFKEEMITAGYYQPKLKSPVVEKKVDRPVDLSAEITRLDACLESLGGQIAKLQEVKDELVVKLGMIKQALPEEGKVNSPRMFK